MKLADNGWMKALRVILVILLVLAAGADTFVPAASAQSAGGEVVVAQNDGPGGFFRRLFRSNRRQQEPRQFQLFPEFGAPEAPPPIRQQRPKQQKKARAATSAPAQPKEPPPVEKAADAKRALVIGDFMAGALAKGLTDAFRDNPNATVIDLSSGSSGLVRDDYYNWAQKVPELVTEQKPDAILIMIGGNDRQTIHNAGTSISFGTDEWRAAYTSRVIALADSLKASGKPVLWGGLVPVASSAMSGDYSAFNGIFREQLEARGLQFIDMWNGFADEDGKYVAFGPDIRGQSAQLRADDGLNFTRAGQRKLAYFVEQNLSDLFGGAVTPVAITEPAKGATGVVSPLIGPMVPLDALEQGSSDALSGGVRGQPGNITTAVAARLTREDAKLPPAGRADSSLWPLSSPTLAPAPSTLPGRGPR
jgi:hypothetical protein